MVRGSFLLENSLGESIGRIEGVKEVQVHEKGKRTNVHPNSGIVEV